MINAVILNQEEYDYLYYNMEGYKDQTRALKEEIKKLKNENESLKIKLNSTKHQVTSARIFYKNLMKQIDAKAEEQDFKEWAESLDFRYNHDLSLACWSYNSESFNNETEEEFIDDCDWYYNKLNQYALKNQPEPTHGWPENPTFWELYQMDNLFNKLYKQMHIKTKKEIWNKIEKEAMDIIDEWQSYGVMAADLDYFAEEVYNRLMEKYGII